MSEPLDEFGEPESEFFAEAFDPTLYEHASPPPGSPPGTVTGRFFNADGSVKEQPDFESSSDAFVSFYGAQQAEQEASVAPAGPDASAFPDPGPRGEHVAAQEFMASVDASMRAAELESERALQERVARAGAAPGIRVSDPVALAAVAEQVQAQIGAWWSGELAKGASLAQGEAAVASPQFQAWLDERIADGLAEAAYERVTSRTKMRRHSDGAWKAAELEERLGGEPAKPLLDKYPGLAKMAARMSAYASRQGEQREVLALQRAQTKAAQLRERAAHPERFSSAPTSRRAAPVWYAPEGDAPTA
jgi:hypothetical protein